ncbi:hypothetical protein JTB14_010307 [Gonioctena quinquepunctata]|nr:hypothetical protein JTB14_010307 [Gonioctena quinquepunctata]
MGIRGLTTFIENNALLEKYELHDTNLVIDGHSVFPQLYHVHTMDRNICFGGDYDKFADYIDRFFDMLDKCNVTPYVVFEGGIEHRKLKIKIKKVDDRLEKVIPVTCTFDKNHLSYIPLCAGDVFENIVLRRKIKTVRCELESYTAIISIAKTLNCPILSYDSEYFMCSEITYIPFRSLCRFKEKPYPYVIRRIKTNINYMSCQIFNVEKFLKTLKLTADKLSLLAAMLGNAFIENTEFPNYFTFLYPENMSFQDRIFMIASWIEVRSVDSAVKEILDFAAPVEKTSLRIKLQNALKGYNCSQSKYVTYLGIPNKLDLPDNYVELENNNLLGDIPTVFLENYRKCRYSHHLMDILIHNQYLGFKPQIENILMPHSHILSEDIVGAIHKILTNSHTNLYCLAREGEYMIKKREIPLCKVIVPSFEEIQDMNVEERRFVILKILGLSFLEEDDIQVFPESWQLFVIVLLYLHKNSSITWSLCYSLVLCRIILGHKDDKKGRLYRVFEASDFAAPNSQSIEKGNLDDETLQILNEMQSFIEFFYMSDELRNSSFDKNLVHSMSEFRSCLCHIQILNDLCNMPFQEFSISDCYNGTFVYNFTEELEKQQDIDDYVEISLLQSSTRIIGCQTASGKPRPKIIFRSIFTIFSHNQIGQGSRHSFEIVATSRSDPEVFSISHNIYCYYWSLGDH